MTRPDPTRIARNARTVFGNAGETAILRSYSGNVAGIPRFGIATTNAYTQCIITAMFFYSLKRGIQSQENYSPGGIYETRALNISTTYPLLNARDELIWRGTAYRVDATPMPENLGGTVQYQAPLVMSTPTG